LALATSCLSLCFLSSMRWAALLLLMLPAMLFSSKLYSSTNNRANQPVSETISQSNLSSFWLIFSGI
jgi:hypothetical protein